VIIIKKLKTLLLIAIGLVSVLLLSYKVLDKTTPNNLREYRRIEIYDTKEKLIYSAFNNQEHTWISLNEINPLFLDTLIFSEDKRFYQHSGFDFLRISKSAYNNIRHKGNLEGASTLTQQLSRTIFLNNEKSLSRKTKELYYALYLESRFSKAEILEAYINLVFAGHGQTGFSEGSKFYFDKQIGELNLNEFLILTNCIKNPTYYSPILNYNNAIQAKNSLAEMLFANKRITENQLYEVLQSNIIPISAKKTDKDNSLHYFIDYVLTNIKEKKNYNIKNMRNYLKIATEYDSELASQINKKIPNYADLEVAICAIEPYTGYIKTMIGGKDYNTSNFNRTNQAKRQLGSTIKPFIYYTALEKGLSPTTVFKSEKTNFNSKNITYSPDNYNKSYDNTNITMAYALATSDNIYAVKALEKIGQKNFFSTLDKLSFEKPEFNLTLALGSNSESLLNLTTAYNILASEGKNIQPVALTSIQENNKLIYRASFNRRQKQILNSDSVFILSDLLTGTFDSSLNQKNRVTGELIANELTKTYAGKSGLTDTDSYMLGFNPQLTLGIWVGYDDNKPLTETNELRVAKKLWAFGMESYMQEKQDYWYNPPLGVYQKNVYLTEEYRKGVYFRQ